MSAFLFFPSISQSVFLPLALFVSLVVRTDPLPDEDFVATEAFVAFLFHTMSIKVYGTWNCKRSRL